jgi:hypothetical protein
VALLGSSVPLIASSGISRMPRPGAPERGSARSSYTGSRSPSSRLAAQPARERRAPARARHLGEGPLGVDRA